ncbi:MAG: hypothetical protein AB2L14_36615 [Candidatus Xenobiia bacterium LiM19]
MRPSFFPAGSYAPRFTGDKADPQVFTNTYPAGGLYSTPEDMGHVAMMLMNGGMYNGVQVLSRKSVEEIGKDQTLSLPVNPVSSESYGLGWDWVTYPRSFCGRCKGLVEARWNSGLLNAVHSGS